MTNNDEMAPVVEMWDPTFVVPSTRELSEPAPMQTESLPPPAKRKFKFHSKTKTGCRTCKTRKVKCDEAKPACRRCTSTGRRCDGYGSPSNSTPGSVAGSSSPGSTLALTTSPSLLPLFDSAEAKRSFGYFQLYASKQLGGSFHSSFWCRGVMQAAIHHPSIRHLVVALGAAYETSEAELTGRGSSEQVEFALQQCNASIRHLTALSAVNMAKSTINPLRGGESQSSSSPESVACLLTASILFIHFAHIRGHNTEAFQHIRSAIKVLRGFNEASITSSDRDSTNNSRVAFPVPVPQLRGMLISAYGQLRDIVEDAKHEIQGGEEYDMLITPDLKPATIFLSVAEAHQYVETLFYNTLAFLQHSNLYPPHPPVTPEHLREVALRHRDLGLALESSHQALDVLVASMGGESDSQVENGIIILQIYHIILAIWLRIDALQPERRESAFDSLEADLESILLLCERFVANEARTIRLTQPLPRSLRCSSGLGIVMPLHTVCVRCRSPTLRKRAIAALGKCARRDGLWDSYITSIVARETVEVAERFSVGGPEGTYWPKSPEADRVGMVRALKFELRGDRSALLRVVVVGRDEVWKVVRW